MRYRKCAFAIWFSVFIASTLVAACGGGGGGGTNSVAPLPSLGPPGFHSVTISWQPNHETGVNSAGGGYLVTVSGQPAAINVPYNAASGVTPTSTTLSLYTGIYSATVQAYATLDANGGATGSTSAPSAPLTITVP